MAPKFVFGQRPKRDATILSTYKSDLNFQFLNAPLRLGQLAFFVEKQLSSSLRTHTLLPLSLIPKRDVGIRREKGGDRPPL